MFRTYVLSPYNQGVLEFKRRRITSIDRVETEILHIRSVWPTLLVEDLYGIPAFFICILMHFGVDSPFFLPHPNVRRPE